MTSGRRFAAYSLLAGLLLTVLPVRSEPLAELNNRAVVAAHAGKLKEAYRLLQKAIASDPRFAVVEGNLARVVEEISRRDYGKALDVDAAPRELSLKRLTPLVKSPTPAPSAGPDSAILTLLAEWSGAWSAQDVTAYLGFYADDFHPPGGLDRAAWEALRRKRLHRPRWIQVQIKNVQVVDSHGDRVRVRFDQEYRSDRYRDHTRKELTLVHTPKGWRIQAERSL